MIFKIHNYTFRMVHTNNHQNSPNEQMTNQTRRTHSLNSNIQIR